MATHDLHYVTSSHICKRRHLCYSEKLISFASFPVHKCCVRQDINKVHKCINDIYKTQRMLYGIALGT